MEAEKPVFLQSRLLSATTSRFPPDHLKSYYITQATSIFPWNWQLCQNLSISELSQKPAENCIAFCCLRNIWSNPPLINPNPNELLWKYYDTWLIRRNICKSLYFVKFQQKVTGFSSNCLYQLGDCEGVLDRHNGEANKLYSCSCELKKLHSQHSHPKNGMGFK